VLNIAIFGGSFDPPHLGHVKIVETALSQLELETLFVVPTYLSPFKESFSAPASMRLTWLQKLFLGTPKTEVLSFECDQHRQVPTIETVLHVKTLFPDAHVYLILGSDAYESLHLWKRYDELQTLVECVVATRHTNAYPHDLKILPIHVNISSSKLREAFDEAFVPHIIREEVKAYYVKESNG
jgi:nicotinate-nucleotide adenylyltransferase